MQDWVKKKQGNKTLDVRHLFTLRLELFKRELQKWGDILYSTIFLHIYILLCICIYASNDPRWRKAKEKKTFLTKKVIKFRFLPFSWFHQLVHSSVSRKKCCVTTHISCIYDVRRFFTHFKMQSDLLFMVIVSCIKKLHYTTFARTTSLVLGY